MLNAAEVLIHPMISSEESKSKRFHIAQSVSASVQVVLKSAVNPAIELAKFNPEDELADQSEPLAMNWLTPADDFPLVNLYSPAESERGGMVHDPYFGISKEKSSRRSRGSRSTDRSDAPSRKDEVQDHLDAVNRYIDRMRTHARDVLRLDDPSQISQEQMRSEEEIVENLNKLRERQEKLQALLVAPDDAVQVITDEQEFFDLMVNKIGHAQDLVEKMILKSTDLMIDVIGENLIKFDDTEDLPDEDIKQPVTPPAPANALPAETMTEAELERLTAPPVDGTAGNLENGANADGVPEPKTAAAA